MSIRSRSIVAFAAATALLTACDGLKEALTAHVDVVARAGSQELSVTRLSNLLGSARIPVPVSRENTALLADLWSGYQQLAFAAAHGDSLNDKKAIDAAVAPLMNGMRLQKFMEQVSKGFKADSGGEAQYTQGAYGLLAARHILFAYPPAATPAQKDSVHKAALAVRPQVNDANFTAMAKKFSKDPGVTQNGGDYGVFPKNAMVPQFSNATAALKPGEISQPIESQFGWHIIQRLPYDRVKAQYGQQYAQASMVSAESTYMARLDSNAKIEVKDGAPSSVRAAVKDQDAHREDGGTLATFDGGKLTVAEFLNWLETYPPQQRQQIVTGVPTAPDSLLKPFVRNIAERQVLLKRADSAKVDVDPQEKVGMYNEFQQLVTTIWQALNVDPRSLADSAKSTAEKERLAATRVEAYLDKVLAGQAQLVSIAPPLKKVLNQKYPSSVNAAGVDRAFQQAQKVRAAADSARAANQPRSQVPIPGMGAPGGAPVQPPAQAPKAKPDSTKKP